MNKGPENPIDLDVLSKDVSAFIDDEEELLCEIRRDIEEYHLIWNLKADNKTDTLRTLIVKIKAKIKILWEKYCE